VKLRFVLGLALFTPAAIAQTGSPTDQPPSARGLIDGIKNFESTIGLPKTRNFEHDSDTVQSYYRCYYTGALELPESYDELKLREGSETGCGMDPKKYDMFFYAMQAAGSGKTAVTSSLAHSSPERILVVVPHEDYHSRKDLPVSIAEAAATLIGFVTAADYARQQLSANSSIYQNLSAESDLFLKKSIIVNRYYSKLQDVYDRLHSGRITSPMAFAEKGRLFEELRSECDAITPNPHSFNKAVSAYNNAGLAFDRTYTKFYPQIYALFESRGRDLKSTIEALDGALNAKALSERQAEANIGAVTKAHNGQ
jgi:hypothetical protein